MKKINKKSPSKTIFTLVITSLIIASLVLLIIIISNRNNTDNKDNELTLNVDVAISELTSNNFEVRNYSKQYLNDFNENLSEYDLEVEVEQMLSATSTIGSASITIIQFVNSEQANTYLGYIQLVEGYQEYSFKIDQNILYYATSSIIIDYLIDVKPYQ